MSDHIWRMSHPYAAVTDASGAFELKYIPTAKGMTLWVWHEMLPSDDLKRLATIDPHRLDKLNRTYAIPH